MPIEAPAGSLVVEDAKFRASSVEATIAVGIGTDSNDAYPLQVFKETAPDIRISEGSTISSAARLYSNNSNLYIQTGGDFSSGSSGDVAFQTMGGQSTHMVIKNDGKVGVGVTNPAYELDVVGAANISSTLKVSERIINNEGIYKKKYTYTGVAANDDLYIGQYSVYGTAAKIEIFDNGNALGSGSRFTLARHYGRVPNVSGYENSYYTTYRFFYEAIDNTNYHVWLRTDRAGNYNIYVDTSNFTDATEPSSPTLTECNYGIFSGFNVGIGIIENPSTRLEVNGDIGIGRVAGGYTFREVPGGDIRAGIHSDSTNHLLFKVDNNDTVLIIDATGTAGTRLRMNRASNGAQAYTIASGDAINSSVGLSSELGIHCGSGGGTIGFYGNYSSIGNKRHAYFKNGALFIEYSANNNNSTVNFTGQHRTWVKDASSVEVAKLYEGMIVSSCHDEYIRMDGGVAVGIDAITINECLPLVSLSNVAYDKRCFGVLSSSEDPEKRESTYGNLIQKLIKEEGDTRVFINSLGEGAIWVVNTAGSLESGDYITTSNVSGYGQRQSDDILHNYTVGKITMNCDFNPSIRPKKQIKKELKDVTYYYSWNSIDEEIYNVMVENGETNKKIETDENGVNIYYRRDETKEYREDWDIEVRQELVNVLDEHGQLQWEDDPSGATEPAYKIRYLDASGQQTDEANAVHIAAFVGCTYHCG